MGEAAKAFWLEEEFEQEQEPVINYEDVSFLSTGVSDDLWKCGAD